MSNCEKCSYLHWYLSLLLFKVLLFPLQCWHRHVKSVACYSLLSEKAAFFESSPEKIISLLLAYSVTQLVTHSHSTHKLLGTVAYTDTSLHHHEDTRHPNPVLLRWSRKHTQWLLLGAHTYSLSCLHATSCMLAWCPQTPAESQCCVSHHGAFFVVEVQFVSHSFIFPPREKPTTPSTLFLWYKQCDKFQYALNTRALFIPILHKKKEKELFTPFI